MRIALRAEPPNVHAIGAKVTATAGDTSQVRTVTPARSYLSSVELPATFGLGAASSVDAVTVRWPGGDIETWTQLDAGRTHLLRKGTGRKSGPDAAALD